MRTDFYGQPAPSVPVFLPEMQGAGENEKRGNATFTETLGDHEREQKGKQENHKTTVVGASERMTES